MGFKNKKNIYENYNDKTVYYIDYLYI